MICIDRIVMICTEATTEVEALKKARKKLKARVNEIQQEHHDAVKKCETLERDASAKEAELSKARQSAETARNECWKYALEAIINWLLLYFLVHDKRLLSMLVLIGNSDTCVDT